MKVYGLHGLTLTFFATLWKTFHFWTFLKMSKNKNLSAFYKIFKNDFSRVYSVYDCYTIYGHNMFWMSEKLETDNFIFFGTFFGRSRFWTFLKRAKHASPKTCNLAKKYSIRVLTSHHIWSQKNSHLPLAFLSSGDASPCKNLQKGVFRVS